MEKDEKEPELQKEKEPQAIPGVQEFADSLGQLAESARNVGVRFLEMVAGTSVERGTNVIDRLLAPFEGGDSERKKKKPSA